MAAGGGPSPEQWAKMTRKERTIYWICVALVCGILGAMAIKRFFQSLCLGLYNRQLHQTEIDAIRAKAKQLADAGGISYKDALQRLPAQALRDVDLQYATTHPGGDAQAQARLDEVKTANPAAMAICRCFRRGRINTGTRD